MTGLTVTPVVDDSIDLLGKVASDLQEDIVVDDDNNAITGTLKYIADYSSAGYTGDEESGNFLVLHFDVPGETGVTLKTELVGGIHGEQTLDEDGICIFRISNKSSQTVKVVASKDGCVSVTKTFKLKGLTLQSA